MKISIVKLSSIQNGSLVFCDTLIFSKQNSYISNNTIASPLVTAYNELLIKWLHLFLITYCLHLQVILTCCEEVSRLLSEA